MTFIFIETSCREFFSFFFLFFKIRSNDRPWDYISIRQNKMDKRQIVTNALRVTCYQLDSEAKRKRSRSESSSPKSSPTTIRDRIKLTPHKKRLTGANASSARLAAIQQRMRDNEMEENERAMTCYRQPADTPNRKRVKFSITPECARGHDRSDSSPDVHGDFSEISPLQFKKLNFDEDEIR